MIIKRKLVFEQNPQQQVSNTSNQPAIQPQAPTGTVRAPQPGAQQPAPQPKPQPKPQAKPQAKVSPLTPDQEKAVKDIVKKMMDDMLKKQVNGTL